MKHRDIIFNNFLRSTSTTTPYRVLPNISDYYLLPKFLSSKFEICSVEVPARNVKITNSIITSPEMSDYFKNHERRICNLSNIRVSLTVRLVYPTWQFLKWPLDEIPPKCYLVSLISLKQNIAEKVFYYKYSSGRQSIMLFIFSFDANLVLKA